MSNGGADRDRTGDLKLAKLALSQLSYGPSRGSGVRYQVSELHLWHLIPDNLTPDWWAWVDSNYRPHAYQACALTT